MSISLADILLAPVELVLIRRKSYQGTAVVMEMVLSPNHFVITLVNKHGMYCMCEQLYTTKHYQWHQLLPMKEIPVDRQQK